MHEFKHPNYYKKLKASQEKKAISPEGSTDPDGRTPVTHPDLLPAHGPEYYAPRRKRRSSSNKQQAAEAQASSYKRLKPASNKPQAPGRKAQASSHKRQAP
jgi:hypothetical protein